MNRMTYAADLTIDGVPVQAGPHVAINYQPLTASWTFDAPADFWEAFRPRHAGASDDTLRRRMRYGGRKGRAARRRLRAKAPVMAVTVGGLTSYVRMLGADLTADDFIEVIFG